MISIVTRHERVVLSLRDEFSTGVAKAAAATALLDNRLNALDGTSVRARGSVSQAAQSIGQFDRNAGRSSDSINQLTGRLRLYVDALAGIGPAAVPIAGAAIPALAGMATQLGLVVAAGGIAVATFAGMGDALTALNEAQLDPTEDNLAALRLEMEKMGPAGAEFVRFLDQITPQLKALQMTAREGALPGFQEGIESLLTMGPQVNRIIGEIATTMGDLAAQSGEALAGPQFAAFVDMLDDRAAPLLREFGDTLGNVAEGIANLFVGLEPLTSQFSSGLLSMTEDFAAWSRELAGNQGFQGFVDYIRETGPQVVDLLGSVAQALGALAQAAAPIGQILVPALTAVADAFTILASSPIGTPLLAAAAALAVFNRAAQLSGVAAASMTRATTALGGMSATARTATTALVGLELGILAVKSLQQAAEGAMPTVNELTGSLMGLQAGRVSSLGAEFDDLTASIGRLADPHFGEQFGDNMLKYLSLGQLEGNRLREAKSDIEALDAALMNLASTGGAGAARDAFESLAVSQGLSAAKQEQLMGLLPRYRDALAGAANAAANLRNESAPGGFAGFITALYETGAAATEEALALERSAQAARNKQLATLSAFDAETQYRQALVAARDAAKANTAGIRGNSEAALANRGVLSGLAAAWQNQSQAVRTNVGRQREARRAFIAAAEGMGVGSAKARELAREMLGIPRNVKPKVDVNTQRALAAITGVARDLFGLDRQSANPRVTADTGQAQSAIASVSSLLNSIPRYVESRVVTIHSTVNGGRSTGGGIPLADGGEVSGPGGPRDDKVPAWLSDGEFVVNAAATQRHRALLHHINARKFADGGEVGLSYSLDQRSELIRLQQSIRDLTKSLNATGKKNRLRGLDREAAQLDRQQARRDLRVARNAPRRERIEALREQRQGLRDVARGFDLDDNATVDEIRTELAELRRGIREAGGEWTRALQRDADRLIKRARSATRLESVLEREAEKRETMTELLKEQESALDSLISTMEQYSSSVAGNFLGGGFGEARTSSETRTVAGPTSPALLAARDQLGAARADLGRLSAAGDPGAVLAQLELIKGLRSQVSSLEGERGTTTVEVRNSTTALEDFQAQLIDEAKRAETFGDALERLSGEISGDFFAQLAASGNVETATQLAALNSAEIDQFEALWQQRAKAAGEVAAFATQQVYAGQQAALEAQIAGQNALINKQTAVIGSLEKGLGSLRDALNSAKIRPMIGEANIYSPMDLDLVMQRAAFAGSSGSLGG